MTNKQLAKTLKVSVSTICRAKKNPNKYPTTYQKINDLLKNNDQTGVEPNLQDGEVIYNNGTLSATKILNTNPANLTLDQLRSLFDIDGDKWECTGYKCGAHNVTMKNKQMEPMVITNYNVKATFKPINNWVFNGKEELQYIVTRLTDSPLKEPKIRFKEVNNNTLVLPLYDVHFGKYSWEGEVDDNVDIFSTKCRYEYALYELLNRVNLDTIDNILFPIGSDFFHYDNIEVTTTNGTRQDTQTTLRQVFREGVEWLESIIDELSNHCNIDVFYVPGNHDTKMSFFALEVLRAQYSNNGRVTVDSSAKSRQYRQIGINLLGFTHGDDEGDRLFELMQSEQRTLWGVTEYSEWFVGHTHHMEVKEKSGVVKRTVGTLAGDDNWHYKKGYTTSYKTMQAFLYNKELKGPITTYQITL